MVEQFLLIKLDFWGRRAICGQEDLEHNTTFIMTSEVDIDCHDK